MPDPDTTQTGETEDKGIAAADAGTDDKGQADTAAADADDKAAAIDWREGISDKDVRALADRYPSAAELARQAYDWRAKLANAVVVPGKSATAEEVAAFHKALGVPEAPDGYKLNFDQDVIGDSGGEVVKKMLAKMHEAGTSQAQVQAAFDAYTELAKAASAADEEALKQAADEKKAILIKEWGGDASANHELAKSAASEFGGPELKLFLETVEIDGVLLGDHPVFMRAFANIGRMVGEARPLIGVSDDQRSTIEAEYEQIRAKQRDHLARGQPAQANVLDKRAMELAAKLGGSGPPIGVGGRTV